MAVIGCGVETATAPARVAPPPGIEITTLALSPGFSEDATLFLGTADDGVFVSGDGGETWQPSQESPAGRVNQIAVAADADDELVVFAAADGGLFQTDGDFLAWIRISPDGSFSAQSVAVSPDYSESGLIVASMALTENPSPPPLSVMRSNDGGETWEALVDAPDRNLEFLPDGTLVGELARFSLWSTDEGDSWTKSPESNSATRTTFSPAFTEDGVRFYGGGFGAPVRRVADGAAGPQDLGFGLAMRGHSCDRDSSGYGPHERCTAAISLSPEFQKDGLGLAPAATFGLLRTDDGGFTWSGVSLRLDEPVEEIEFSPAFASDKTVYIVSGRGIYVSTDGGVSWSGAPSGASAPDLPVAAGPESKDPIFVISGASALEITRSLELAAEVPRPIAGSEARLYRYTNAVAMLQPVLDQGFPPPGAFDPQLPVWDDLVVWAVELERSIEPVGKFTVDTRVAYYREPANNPFYFALLNGHTGEVISHGYLFQSVQLSRGPDLPIGDFAIFPSGIAATPQTPPTPTPEPPPLPTVEATRPPPPTATAAAFTTPGDRLRALYEVIVEAEWDPESRKTRLKARILGGPDISPYLRCTTTGWDFGDGFSTMEIPGCIPGRDEMPIQREFGTLHSYERAGVYEVTFSRGQLTADPVLVAVGGSD